MGQNGWHLGGNRGIKRATAVSNAPVEDVLTFNVVFTPGTVRYLAPAVYTLLDWGQCRFRLVGNALGPTEARELYALAESNSRLSAVLLPARQMLPHGLVLSLLYRQYDDGPFFAFCDPDVFAVGPFDDLLRSHLETCDVFSSCYHVSLKGRVYGGDFVGRSLYGPGGIPLATTFFAVYRRAGVDEVWQRWGVGFERYLFPEHIPERVRRVLESRGLFLPPYDTAKLLNALQHVHGLRIRYADIPVLHHVGGVCRALLPGGYTRELLQVDPLRLVTHRCVITNRTLVQIYRYYASARARRGNAVDEESCYLLALRTCIALYFAAFLKHLVDGCERPLLRLRESSVVENVERLCTIVRQAYCRHLSARTAA